MVAPLLERVAIGTPLTTRAVGGWRVTHTRHVPGLRLNAHRHAQANFVCLLRGSYEETIGRSTLGCSDRSVVVKPGGEEHSDRYGSAGADCLIVEAMPPALRVLGRLSAFFDSVSHLREPSLSLLAAEICAELAHGDRSSPLAIEALATELVARGVRMGVRERRETPLLERTREFLHANFRDELTLSRIAGEVGRHPAHIARTFRNAYRCSLGDYVRRLRLDHAASELLSTEHSISSIAAEAGFYDHPHFCRLFRAHFGMTPAEFRRAARE